MKTLLAVLFASTCMALFAADGDGASTPTVTAAGSHVYGQPMPLGKPLAIGLALADASHWRGRAGKFEGRITEVCQNKGCWLVLADGDRHARVFSGHAFFLPKDTSGHAVVHGTLSERTVSEEFARHLAEDSGRDPATVVGEQVEYRIDAASVELLPAS